MLGLASPPASRDCSVLLVDTGLVFLRPTTSLQRISNVKHLPSRMVLSSASTRHLREAPAHSSLQMSTQKAPMEILLGSNTVDHSFPSRKGMKETASNMVRKSCWLEFWKLFFLLEFVVLPSPLYYLFFSLIYLFDLFTYRLQSPPLLSSHSYHTSLFLHYPFPFFSEKRAPAPTYHQPTHFRAHQD